MKAINSKTQINSMTPFGQLISFDKPSVDIKSDYDFTKNYSQYYRVEDKKARGRTANGLSQFNILLAHQREIIDLQNKIKILQHENSTLVKWIKFLF
jgi:hypothetical protein